MSESWKQILFNGFDEKVIFRDQFEAYTGLNDVNSDKDYIKLLNNSGSTLLTTMAQSTIIQGTDTSSTILIGNSSKNHSVTAVGSTILLDSSNIINIETDNIINLYGTGSGTIINIGNPSIRHNNIIYSKSLIIKSSSDSNISTDGNTNIIGTTSTSNIIIGNNTDNSRSTSTIYGKNISIKSVVNTSDTDSSNTGEINISSSKNINIFSDLGNIYLSAPDGIKLNTGSTDQGVSIGNLSNACPISIASYQAKITSMSNNKLMLYGNSSSNNIAYEGYYSYDGSKYWSAGYNNGNYVINYNGSTANTLLLDTNNNVTMSPSINTIPTGATGSIIATKLYNAVWNDIVDYLDLNEDNDIDIIPGKCYVMDDLGNISQSVKKSQKGTIGIVSDTYGFGVGSKNNIKQAPIAIGGYVLAYTRGILSSGDPLVSGSDGYLVKASILDRILHPERIVAIYLKDELKESWNEIKVNNRNWVKVK